MQEPASSWHLVQLELLGVLAKLAKPTFVTKLVCLAGLAGSWKSLHMHACVLANCIDWY